MTQHTTEGWDKRHFGFPSLNIGIREQRNGLGAAAEREMGGKGRKRREKNYRAAHGAQNRLPPPPTAASVDAVPSKLRKLMSFTNSPQLPGPEKLSGLDTGFKKRGEAGNHGLDKKSRSEDESNFKTSEVKREVNNVMEEPMDHGDEIENNGTHEKKKKKRKRKPVDDLRFLADELAGVGSKRKERKKKRLEAMKNKHKKVKAEDNTDFPGHEEIKFGEVVLAPPKLVSFPKASKVAHDASKERIRLKAVEAYRNRRGWASRPGIHLPPPEITTTL